MAGWRLTERFVDKALDKLILVRGTGNGGRVRRCVRGECGC